MIISIQNRNLKLNSICLYLLVVTTLIGPLVYIGFASLYHFFVLGMLFVVLLKGINTAMLKTDIMTFLSLWLVEALVSTVWAPDKGLALQYVYYILMIVGVCVLFHCLLTRDNLPKFMYFMVIVLFACNVIAIWEMTTGNHLVKGYLATPLRLRLLKYMPGGFYRNPNDFATYIIQIVPFSFVSINSSKRWIRTASAFNIVSSFFVICATQSRAQILLMLGMCLFFLFVSRKKSLLKYGFLACVFAVILYLVYPEFSNLIDEALQSISGESLAANAASEGGSLNIRINLLKNAGHILLDTFGFGIGAGCHRVVMAEYSAQYYNIGSIYVMHNLPAEIFVDYGILVGCLFIVTILRSCRRLIWIYKSEKDENVRLLAIMLAFFIGGFILCGMSSSSILQLTSVWTMFCFISAFMKLYYPNNS